MRRNRSDALIRRHMIVAFGVGLVPLPIVDIVAVKAIMLNLIRLLARRHGVSFDGERARVLVVAFLASVTPVALGGIASSSLKVLPVVGGVAGGASVALLAAASVYAAGHLLDAHFASGGTFLTFDIKVMQKGFRREFEAGQKASVALERELAAPPAASRPVETSQG